MARSLVVLDELFHMVGVLEDVQAADASESELLGADASVANLSHGINSSTHKKQITSKQTQEASMISKHDRQAKKNNTKEYC